MRNRRDWPALVGLVLLLGLHLWLGLDWIGQTTHPGGVDEVTNLNWAQRFHLTWTEGAYDNPAWFVLGREQFVTTPPLLFVLTSLTFRAFDTGWQSCLLVSLAALLLWLLATYLLASRLAGRWAGLAAAALLGAGPMAYLFGRTYNTSCLAAAFITLTVWALVASERFTRWPALLVGPLAGLAFLAERATPVVALAGPALVLVGATLLHLRREPQQRRRAALLTLLAAAVALVLSLPFLLTYLTTTWQHNLELIAQPANAVSGPWDQGPGHWYYLRGLLTAQQVPLAALAALFGAPALFKKRREAGLALLAWLALPLAFFAPMAQKSLNYTFSLAAPLCVFAAAGIALIERPGLAWPRRIALAALLLFGVLKPLDTAQGWRVLHLPERIGPDSALRLLIDPVQFQVPEPAPLAGYAWEREIERLLAEQPGDLVLFLAAEPGFRVENARILFSFTLARRPTARAYMLAEPCAAWPAPPGSTDDSVVGLVVAPARIKTAHALAAALSWDAWNAAEYSRDLSGARADAVCRALLAARLEPRPAYELGNGRLLVSSVLRSGLNWPIFTP